MAPRDNDDVQFDFFEDEQPTTEAEAQSRVRMPRRGGRGPGRGPRRPGAGEPAVTPLLRLSVLIAIIVAVLVVFGLLVQGCTSPSKHDASQHYMSKVATIAKSSEDDGTAVANALVTPAAKATTLGGTLNGLAEQERQNVAAATKLDPPGPLRDLNERMIEALQLRVSGVQGLAKTFSDNPTSKGTDEAGVLSQQGDRLLASDVIWDDLYSGPLQQQLTREGVNGVSVPDSNFVSNRDLVSEHSMALLLARLKGASTGGGTPTGIHGTNIVDVKVLPGNQTLSTSTENTITATTDLAFVVTIDDSGDSQEVGIKVTLTIQKASGAIVRTKKLDLINPGQQKAVTFSDLGTVPFAQKTQVLVDVAPVLGEHNTDNNKASFPAIFSLP